ncbi:MULTISPECIES: cysteine peptidase family C39 domain-containing protein [Bradyrhizobium]|jgi:hypothetical protein|uniref:Uncharacterized protein n=1 Tax=Bradyrhizobium elkanii TaxID=29448 RepID=A0A8I2C4X9_BRAEL|nr:MULTISPECIES: hypothetical protein [Bradyrhizobium]MBP1293542.1 hypothetical protein [Bradyrhizobium elkanii]MCP1925873.1 hypothetical protein [Bradyrhizobium elkanii]MCS3476635.1 hypothetical protein [Bradyrhizobium elkanii]MCS3566466.1 hypothetical protein [Bradyrhizobium elkanii]MCS3583373.1 hypothetical protein [Bradyrhizobium elkanii]
MPDITPGKILVPSVLRNLNVILDAITDRPSAPCLGCVWGFGNVDPAATATEFDLPCGWDFYAQQILGFSGIQLDYSEHGGGNAYDRVELGQPIVVAVDSYYLPYRPAWQRVHSARTLVVDRVSIDLGLAEIIDTWMPDYAGPVELADLDRARSSLVPENIEREPLYAGVTLRQRWWTLARVAAPLIRDRDGIVLALCGLAADAIGIDTPARIAAFRYAAVEALSRPIAISRTARRAAALQLRAEIGLRAYLRAFLDLAGDFLEDPLLTAEIRGWSRQLAELASARDVLIKSLAFDRSEYATLVDHALRSAERRERRLSSFISECYPKQQPRSTSAGASPC